MVISMCMVVFFGKVCTPRPRHGDDVHVYGDGGTRIMHTNLVWLHSPSEYKLCTVHDTFRNPKSLASTIDLPYTGVTSANMSGRDYKIFRRSYELDIDHKYPITESKRRKGVVWLGEGIRITIAIVSVQMYEYMSFGPRAREV